MASTKGKIISYLRAAYAPLAILTYGSYGDGSQNEHSDFDALVICPDHEPFHDVSFVEGVQLDVFVYPREHFEKEINCEDFVQLFDSEIVLDTDGCGLALRQRVVDYLEHQPPKSYAQLQSDTAWCRKMALRAERQDAEGLFRWHWVLIDSLEIFCNILHTPYRGPKKSLRWMREHHPEAYDCYRKALSSPDLAALHTWIDCLEAHLTAE